MAAVTRLVTFVDVRDDDADARQIPVSARREAVLANGRRLLLLGDRGWVTGSAGAADIWSETSAQEIERTARFVVGPDEPFDGRSLEDMDADHWAHLAHVLRENGVVVDVKELRQLPHDVVLSARVLARIGRGPDDAVPS